MLEMLAGRHVLVVEDEMLVMMNIEAALSDMGCENITIAANVDAALELIANGDRLDLALLDVNLGSENSFRVADALAQGRIPFLFATGYGERGVDARFRDRPILQKPYSDAQLAGTIAGLLPIA